MPISLTTLTLKEIPGLTFACSCGQTHHVAIEQITMGHNIIGELADTLANYSSICLVADNSTYQTAGEKTAVALKNRTSLTELIYPDKHLLPDEAALKKLLDTIPNGLALLLAVGSGTINDLVRYASFKTGIPYMILCTAPSMDGYASVVSPLLVNGIKTTYNAVYPKAIWADIDILKTPPLVMLQAGLGDIFGKYTSLADWRLSHLLFAEHYCQATADLIQKLVLDTVVLAPKLKERSSDLIEALIKGLILSGVTIGMIGSSRPASGEEHHFSHFCELLFHSLNQETGYTHGNYVGLGTEIVLACYDYLKALDIRKVSQDKKYLTFTKEKWQNTIRQAYREHAENIIAYKEKHITFEPALREKRIKELNEKWDILRRDCFAHVPSAAFYKDLLTKAGCRLHPKDIGLTKEQFREAIICAKDIRQRYGAFQLLEDLGLLDKFAVHMANTYYK